MVDNTLKDRLRRAAAQGLNTLQDRIVQFERAGGVEGLARKAGERLRQEEARFASGESPFSPSQQLRVRQWYARLELDPGADATEVRRAYRALMRRYHPDRFTADPDTERVATELSQELTVAYNGLLRHLGEK